MTEDRALNVIRVILGAAFFSAVSAIVLCAAWIIAETIYFLAHW